MNKAKCDNALSNVQHIYARTFTQSSTREEIQHFRTRIKQSSKNFFIQFQNNLLKIDDKVLCSGSYCVVWWSQKNLKFAFNGEDNLTATKEQM